jgi:hypothetical protein
MNRVTRSIALAVAAASLAACSASPMGPVELRCDGASDGCVNKDYVNPLVDYVNPLVDYVNPLV